MTKIDKLIKKFLNKTKDFTWAELKILLNGWGYVEQIARAIPFL